MVSILLNILRSVLWLMVSPHVHRCFMDTLKNVSSYLTELDVTQTNICFAAVPTVTSWPHKLKSLEMLERKVHITQSLIWM